LEEYLKKPYLVLACLASFIMMFLPACIQASPTTEKVNTIRLVGTIGPLSVPLAYMVENKVLSSVAENTTLTIWANPIQLQAIVSGGQGDFISLPTNSASTFYNKGISLKLLDASIWNILYLITDDQSINSLTDLKDQRVMIPYQGAVPDAMFRYVCQAQGVNPDADINIYYAPDPVQASQFLLSGQDRYVLLSEPSATAVILNGQSRGLNFRRALNMKTEWEKTSGNQTSTPVAGTIVLGDMKDNSAVVNTFMNEYKKAVDWMLANPQEAGQVGARVLAEQGFTAGVLTDSLKNIDWKVVSAREARTDLESFFNALAEVSPDYIGGKLPDAGFYYAK
jgi:NitT/TauT family transport system substrate-binding protein